MAILQKQITIFQEAEMKIYPVKPAYTPNFRGNPFTLKKFKSDSKDFFEAAGVVCATSIPMFLYLLCYHLYDKYIRKKHLS